MVDPASGPFLFDTSAESRLARADDLGATDWMRAYLSRHEVHVSAVTVLERIRGYSLLWHIADRSRREQIESARIAYLSRPARVWPLDSAVAVVAAELMAAVPDPPTPLSRWRFDQMIAATALVARMRLVHDNAADFEPLRMSVERAPERFPGLGPLELIRCPALL